ncbi:MAG: hypothetical protein KJZ93_25310 [Caldilineaceae bacterium]|nr:hypothetical protein [Caldilineaceae bacterium]
MKREQTVFVGVLLGVVLLNLAACMPIQPETSAPAPITTVTEEIEMPQSVDAANPLVQQAVADLAERLGVPVDEVELVEAEAVIWPDGSLGCPQPGMMYTQVLQDGMRIVLRVAGEEYHYHSGGSREPFLCEDPTPPTQSP